MIKYIRNHIPFSALIALMFTCYLAYYLLLGTSHWHTSITSIIDMAQTTALPRHLLILAFLPIYIACMIFGSALIGLYLGNTVPTLINRISRKTSD